MADRKPCGRLKQDRPGMTREMERRRGDLVAKGREYSAEAGRALSLLLEWGFIDQRQKDAGDRLRLEYLRYRRLWGLPTRHPVYADGAGLMDRVDPEDPDVLEDARKASRAFKDSMAVMRSAGPVVLVDRLVDMLIIEDHAPETWTQSIVSPVATKTFATALEKLAESYWGKRENAA